MDTLVLLAELFNLGLEPRVGSAAAVLAKAEAPTLAAAAPGAFQGGLG